MNTKLLATKFHIPCWQPTAVSRTRLLESLNQTRKLILLSAPAGYGKTSVLSEWIHSLDREKVQIGWLSLDESDNDLARFLSYFFASMAEMNLFLAEKYQPLFNLPALPAIHPLLDELVNDLVESPLPITLILEDYHLLTNNKISQAIEYFLEHIPAHFKLVITSRQDPPFPLAKLRARGMLTEIRATDLRFTAEEAHQFLTQSMKIRLSDEITQVLEERTEGWAVGLQLAGLALQNQVNPKEFIETFRGSHRYILEFLAEEVLHQQNEETRNFLIETSILERFNADSCNALIDRQDARQILDQLEFTNLFIIPLDDNRNWYRYHRLFTDYLRTQLSKSDHAILASKAAIWHADHLLFPEAIVYALTAQNFELAAEIIEKALNQESTWSDGNVALWLSWLEGLPSHVLENRPGLCIQASRVFYLAGQFSQAQDFDDIGNVHLQQFPQIPDTEMLLTLSALNQGALAAVRGDVHIAIQKTNFGQSRLSKNDHLHQAEAFFTLGLAHEVSNQVETAAEYFIRSSDEARMAGVHFLAVHARCSAAQIQIQLGALSQAEQTCQTAIHLADGKRVPQLGLAWIVLGYIALERNELPTAEINLKDGVHLSRQSGIMDALILGLSYLARYYAILGNLAECNVIILEVSTLLKTMGVSRLSILADALKARIQLFQGLNSYPLTWAKTYLKDRAEINHEFADLVLAHSMLAARELDDLSPILDELLTAATESRRIQTRIEVMLLKASFHQAKNEIKQAQEWLIKALLSAESEGFIRIFLDAGPSLNELLPKVRQNVPAFVDQLLKGIKPPSKAPLSISDEFLVPLSDQESRVLKLILAGMSNTEIAERLFITVGTTKWHVHNIFQKLGVSSRPQAIARSRELGI